MHLNLWGSISSRALLAAPWSEELQRTQIVWWLRALWSLVFYLHLRFGPCPKHLESVFNLTEEFEPYLIQKALVWEPVYFLRGLSTLSFVRRGELELSLVSVLVVAEYLSYKLMIEALIQQLEAWEQERLLVWASGEVEYQMAWVLERLPLL